MIFQDPMSSFNPVFTIGNQIAEAVRLHENMSRRLAWRRAVDALGRVGIPQAERRAHDYPHEFSGGMLQRAMIAMALINQPKVLIADEPTTALDVTIQKQIVELLGKLREEMGMSMLFVTHDMGIVAEICDRVTVMYAGEVVEQATLSRLFAHPQHPYTEALLASIPRVDRFDNELVTIRGRVPTPDSRPSGCRFEPRCSKALPECARTRVPLVLNDGGESRCILTARSLPFDR
jgi:oligopeptide/dipeptide ABC transporter ATP-binding protein